MMYLVCGSRDFADEPMMLDAFISRGIGYGDVVVHGAARGADRMAGRLARARGATETPVKAEWRKGGFYNPEAGFARNSKMLALEPDFVLAFFAGRRTNGTMDTVHKAHYLGIVVCEFGLE